MRNLIQLYLFIQLFPYLPRLITKIDEKMSELDSIRIKINDVYSCGAVEGYTEEHLVF